MGAREMQDLIRLAVDLRTADLRVRRIVAMATCMRKQSLKRVAVDTERERRVVDALVIS